jgi:acyl CoA:acetate/3-ketoacid CoA transferase
MHIQPTQTDPCAISSIKLHHRARGHADGSNVPALSRKIPELFGAHEPAVLSERKIIARRAAFELLPDAVMKLRIGASPGAPSITNKEKILKYLKLTEDPAAIDGAPQSPDFEALVNVDGIIDVSQQFACGGGALDALHEVAGCNPDSNINVALIHGLQDVAHQLFRRNSGRTTSKR